MTADPESREARTVTPMMHFPLAPRGTRWDGDAAEAAIRIRTGADDAPTAAYADCFFWHQADAPNRYGSYKLPYCDVIEGEIKAVPHAIFAVAGILDGARGGTSIPQADQEAIKVIVGQWYKRMAKEFDDEAIVAPWSPGRH